MTPNGSVDLQLARRDHPDARIGLHEDLDYSQPTISKQLGILRKAGLVESRRDGRWVYYSVNEGVLDAARGFLDDLRDSMHRPHAADHCEDPAG